MTPKALSREIKFRAWNPSTKTYGYFEPFKRFELSAEPDYDGYTGKINTWRYKKGAMGDMGMYYEFSISHENVEDLVFQQYTGLLDKNGKEIYEGDIVKVLDRDWIDAEKDTKILVVYYRNDRYILINKAGIEESEKSEPNIYNQEWYEVSLFREYGRDRFEVIGNIYENPELLTKENK